MRSSIFFHSTLLFISVFSCREKEWYEKEFSSGEKKQLAEQLLNGMSFYYQGTVPEQMLYDQAIEYDSSNAAIWREFGTSRVKRGFAKEMYYYYGEAVKRHPEKWMGFRGYLYLYFYRDYARAIADFDQSDEITKYVGHSQGQSHDYMRGICYYGLKDYNRALAYLNKYIESVVENEGEDWVDVYALLYRGLVYEKLGDLSSAIMEFDKALTLYPNLADCFYHKARIFFRRGESGDALKLLKKAKEHFYQGYYHQRPYVEVLGQIYLLSIEEFETSILAMEKTQ